MEKRQKILFVAIIVLLAFIALAEGLVFLLYSTHKADRIALMPRLEAFFAGLSKNNLSQNDKAETDEGILLRETADDLNCIHSQINRLFHEMNMSPAFGWRSVSGRDVGGRDAGRRSAVPFSSMDHMQRLQAEIGRIFERALDSRHDGAISLIEKDWRDVGAMSAVNIEDSGTNYVVTVSMPRVERADIKVSLCGRVLNIEAGNEQREQMNNSAAAYSGRFRTQVMLPGDIAGEAAQAVYEEGVLRITIPKNRSNSLAHQINIM